MRKDIHKHRRQVAWICFEPYLTEAQLLKAIEILERGYQTDSISALIAYISKICGDFGIGAAVRKSLYGKFHELMSKELDLLLDPWTLVEAARQAPALAGEAQSTPPAVEQAAAPEQAARRVEQPLPAHTEMFIGFVQKIIDHNQGKAVFFELLTAVSKGRPKQLQDLMGQWSAAPDDFHWAIGLDEPVLAEIVHLLYTALCELLGPIEADLVFHKAIAKCEQTPVARRFPPTRFL